MIIGYKGNPAARGAMRIAPSGTPAEHPTAETAISRSSVVTDGVEIRQRARGQRDRPCAAPGHSRMLTNMNFASQ